jgi:hypothetical protein
VGEGGGVAKLTTCILRRVKELENRGREERIEGRRRGRSNLGTLKN